MLQNLTNLIETRYLKPDGSNYTVAAGTTPVTSEPVDTQGVEAVRFVIGFGAIVAGAVTSIKARQGAQSNMSDGADLEGTGQAVADTDDNKLRIVDLYRPEKRYVDLVTLRATQNATINFLIAELYGGRRTPVEQHSTVAGVGIHASPDEGAA